MSSREHYHLRVEKAIENKEWEKFHAKFIRILKRKGKENDSDFIKELEVEVNECIEATTGKVLADLRLAIYDLIYKKKNMAALFYWYETAVLNNDYTLK